MWFVLRFQPEPSPRILEEKLSMHVGHCRIEIGSGASMA